MRVAVYTIALDEEHHVDGWAASTADADYRLILDTGSKDNTLVRATDLGVHVNAARISPWRFDDARNTALALVPDDVDYCVALDMDERLQPGWRDALEVAWAIGFTQPRYHYVWNWTEDGAEGVTYGGDKVHTRFGYRWKHPCHETLVPTTDEHHVGWVDGLAIHHHADAAKSRAQYLPLLQRARAEDPHDPRLAFYLARELAFDGQTNEARDMFMEYLRMPAADWAPERAAAMRHLAQVSYDPERWLLRACAEAPGHREPWIDLADYHLGHGDAVGAVAALQRALTITERPKDLYLSEPAAWDGTVERLLAQLVVPGEDPVTGGD